MGRALRGRNTHLDGYRSLSGVFMSFPWLMRLGTMVVGFESEAEREAGYVVYRPA